VLKVCVVEEVDFTTDVERISYVLVVTLVLRTIFVEVKVEVDVLKQAPGLWRKAFNTGIQMHTALDVDIVEVLVALGVLLRLLDLEELGSDVVEVEWLLL
jgi:hypothetical protein